MRMHIRLSYHEGQETLKRKLWVWMAVLVVLAIAAAAFGFWTDKTRLESWHIIPAIALALGLLIAVTRVSHYAERID